MQRLDLNGFHLITSFLTPLEIKRLGICSKQNKEICKHFMTYSYNEYGSDENYVKIQNVKWIVEGCTEDMLNDIANKQLNICVISFDKYFNNPIDALSNCTQLQHLTFGYAFNQPINALSKCTQLQQLIFGYTFNQPINALIKCTTLETLLTNKNYKSSVRILQQSLPNLKWYLKWYSY